MKRSMQQLAWRGIVTGALLLIGHYTLVWAGNVSPSIQDTGANVGIGTTSPRATLDVTGTNFDSSVSTSALDVNGALVRIGDMGGNQTFTNGSGIKFFDNNVAHASIKYLSSAKRFDFCASSTGAALTCDGTPALSVKTGTGNVGIGTVNPSAKLHVAGDAQVDGNLAAKYQDVAEWVQASSPLTSGTVVVVDHQGRNQVLPASQPYDTRVAGVVSAKPGLLLGEPGEDRVKVAHSGRVKVKVDATYGPIAAGDLLVTSFTPGRAMRSTPVSLGETLIHRPGTLLGKALEPLEEGQGEILVLLTLQ